MINELIGALDELGLHPTAEELADALWLVDHQRRLGSPVAVPTESAEAAETAGPAGPARSRPSLAPGEPAFGSTEPYALARALRSLKTLGAGPRQETPLERAATMTSDGGIAAGMMSLSARRPEGRLDLAVVVDVSASMEVWRQSGHRLRSQFHQLGVFRRVRIWTVDADRADGREPTLRSDGGQSARSPGELMPPSGRQVVLVLSDCVGPAWRNGSMDRLLALWARSESVAIVQPLPQRLWAHTGLRATRVQWRCPVTAAVPTNRIAWRHQDALRVRGDAPDGIPIPVLKLEPRWLEPWAAMVSGTGTGRIGGVARITDVNAREPVADGGEPGSALDRILRFRLTASPQAMTLASHLATVSPLTMPVMRLVQGTLSTDTTDVHLAEVFLGGLLTRTSGPDGHDETRGAYEFHSGVRDLLLTTLTRAEQLKTYDALASYLQDRSAGRTRYESRVPVYRTGDRSAQSGATAFSRMTPATAARLNAVGTVTLAGAASVDAATRPAEFPTSAVPDVTEPRPRPVPAPSRIWGLIPDRNGDFTGRESELAELRTKLSDGGHALLHCSLYGLGGAGKTQIAIEYAHRFADDYDLVWWVPAQQAAGVRTSLNELAQRLGHGTDGTAEPWRAALDSLREGKPCPRWLVVFDNAERPDELGGLLPRGQGHLLVTTRNRRWASSIWARNGTALDIGPLTVEDSKLLLDRSLPEGSHLSEAVAAEFAAATGGLPIALVVMADYLASSTTLSPEQVLARFGDVIPDALADGLPDNYPLPVAAVWQLCIDQLREHSPAAVGLLELCSMFAPEPIPHSLLNTASSPGLPDDLGKVLVDPIEVDRALVSLGRYSLVQIDSGRKTVTVHRLLQTVVRKALSEARRTTLEHAVHLQLRQACPEDPLASENWPEFAALQPHLLMSAVPLCEMPSVRELIVRHVRFLAASGDPAGASSTATDAWRLISGYHSPEDSTAIALRDYISI